MEDPMTLLHWRANMSVGVAELDADHKALIELLNRLHYMVFAGDSQDAVEEVLEDLCAYAACHFAREEALMRAAGYPDVERHSAFHRQLADRLAACRRAYREDSTTFDAKALYDFVSEWLIVHTLEEDKKLEPWLAKVPAALAG